MLSKNGAEEDNDLGYHDKLAVSLFFFSDGCATDNKELGDSIEIVLFDERRNLRDGVYFW